MIEGNTLGYQIVGVVGGRDSLMIRGREGGGGG